MNSNNLNKNQAVQLVLMIAVLFHFFNLSNAHSAELLPAEGGMYKGQKNDSRFAERTMTGAKERTLNVIYSRRMYSGAPPQIPHPVTQDFKPQKTDCLSCHTKGGYVSAFNAYAPVTPHPQFLNCKQCHVPSYVSGFFRPTNWTSVAPPEMNQRQIEGGPPKIPHGLQMRENCLSCHSGPSAARELRTTHPERINCRQCHMVNSFKSQINEYKTQKNEENDQNSGVKSQSNKISEKSENSENSEKIFHSKFWDSSEAKK